MQSDGKIPLNVAMEIVNVVSEFQYTGFPEGPGAFMEQVRRDIAQSIVLFLSGRAQNIYPTEPGTFHPGLVEGGEAKFTRDEPDNPGSFPPGQAPIPELILRQIDNYGENHLMPGDFVLAVVENDLTKTLHFADEKSFAAIKSIWGYCHRALPVQSWGNANLVESWLTFAGKGEDDDKRER